MTESHWRVVFDDRARKDLRRIDPPTRKRILTAITKLGQGAELTGDVKRLKVSDEYRLRVGDWRVRFGPPARHHRRPRPPTRARLRPLRRASRRQSDDDRSTHQVEPRFA